MINLETRVSDYDEGIDGHEPCHLQRALLELEPAFASTPIAGTVDVVRIGLARFRLGNGSAALFPTEGHEGAVGMKDDEVTLKLVDEIELHLCELGVVRGEGLDAVLVS